MTPEGHCQVHGERAQLTLRNGFTAYSFNLPSCPDEKGVTLPAETHLTTEPSEGRLGVLLLQAVIACEVSIGSRSHTGVALPSCLKILSQKHSVPPCLHPGMECPAAPSECAVRDYIPGQLSS